MVDGLVQDIRFGIRMLAKSPGVINAVRLKMLPVGNPTELVILRWSAPDGVSTPTQSTWGSTRSEGGRQSGTSFSYPAFLALRERNQVFSSMFGFVNLGRVSLTAAGDARVLRPRRLRDFEGTRADAGGVIGAG